MNERFADDERFMDMALAEATKSEATGDTPVASIITLNGEVIGVGRNSVRSDHDPTAHAEVAALRDACRRIGNQRIEGLVCYTTMEPCPMCCWALVEGGIGRLVMGARHQKLGRKDYGGYSVEELCRMTGRSFTITTGVRESQCEALRRAWMKKTGVEA